MDLNWQTILVAGIIFVIVLAIIIKGIINKKNGKSSCSSCGGACGGCAMKDTCHPDNKK